jgi:hypothetical protein
MVRTSFPGGLFSTINYNLLKKQLIYSFSIAFKNTHKVGKLFATTL